MKRLIILALLSLCSASSCLAENLILIGNASLASTPMDANLLLKIFTGKVVKVDDQVVTPVNLTIGHPLRKQFLSEKLHQNEEKYTGYWTVRRYIGKGMPPQELSNEGEVIRFVSSTSGSIGYVGENFQPNEAVIQITVAD